MFCRLSYFRTRTQDLDAVIRSFKEKFIPGIAQQPGFKGIEILTDWNTSEDTSEDTSDFVVLKFWDSEENAKLWTKNRNQWQYGSGITPLLIGDAGLKSRRYFVQVRTV